MSQQHRATHPPVTNADTAIPSTAAATTTTGTSTDAGCRSTLGTYPECPLCGGGLFPEHAHFRCSGCGWRDSCCD